MKNDLGMKPGEFRKMFADTFNTLEDLKLAIAKAELVSNQIADVINVDGKLELEAECLSDGSIVYNVGIVGNVLTTWQG
jgi:hypothetical protein